MHTTINSLLQTLIKAESIRSLIIHYIFNELTVRNSLISVDGDRVKRCNVYFYFLH